jgi:hypothetical protein
MFMRLHGASKIENGHFPMVVEHEIHLRSSDHGGLSSHESLTIGNCPSIIYFINRTYPNGHWIWDFLSSTNGKCPGFFKYKAMTAAFLESGFELRIVFKKNQRKPISPPK